MFAQYGRQFCGDLALDPADQIWNAPSPHIQMVIPQHCLNWHYQPYNKMDIRNKAENQDKMADRKYIHWHAEGVEKIPSNEAEDIQAVADMINSMQKAQYNSHRHCYTGQQYRAWKERD